MEAIASNQKLLCGTGLDWGCGTGCLAITASLVPEVTRVVGLDVERDNVEAARRNALSNGVSNSVSFFHSDSYVPLSEDGSAALSDLQGKVDFIVANPPATSEGDGFGWRREVLRGGLSLLKPGGRVFLSISVQYAADRIEGLCEEIPGYQYRGLLATTDWVPFDMERPDLGKQVVEYAEEEKRGGLKYHFRDPTVDGEAIINAQTALAVYHETGLSPLSKWQSYLFVRDSEK
jgi:ribosomal protein L11 methylase PrmA